MALTAFGGRAAYFDHIYLARSIAELDRIDATDSRKTKAKKLTLKQMEQYWKDLLDEDASLAYRALWRLSASTQAVEFLKKKLTPSSRGATLKQIRQWIKELDADEHKIRESATVLLTRHLLIAAPLLKLTLKKPPSLEVKRRIQKILKRMVKSERELLRRAQAIRALEHAGSLESRRCLELLAKDRDHLSTATLAKTALMRLKLRDRK